MAEGEAAGFTVYSYVSVPFLSLNEEFSCMGRTTVTNVSGWNEKKLRCNGDCLETNICCSATMLL